MAHDLDKMQMLAVLDERRSQEWQTSKQSQRGCLARARGTARSAAAPLPLPLPPPVFDINTSSKLFT